MIVTTENNVTTAHFFYIPSIFIVGFFVGAVTSNIVSQKQTSNGGLKSNPKIKGSLLAAAFAILTLIFIVTHIIAVPGGAKSLHAALGHQLLFDRHTSSTANEVYSRLDSFGQAGRAAYKQFTFSGDAVFPISLLVFLVVLAFFVRERTSLSRATRALLILLPLIWFLSDMIENSMIYYLIEHYPEKNIFIAEHLGTITSFKFTLLMCSMALPAVTYALFRTRRNEIINQ